MDKHLVPFCEEAYRNENETVFSAEPNGTLKEFEHLFKKEPKIIEAGCGEGQNVLYDGRRTSDDKGSHF